MNINRHQSLSRRTFLKGAGATLSLPLLEAMLPPAVFGANAEIPRRMGVFYFGTGMNMREFEPKDTGKDFTFSRVLKPLEKFREDMTVFSGSYLEYGGGHQGDYTFLTGNVGKTSSGEVINSISADQVAAAHVGEDTRFPSMQFSLVRGTGFGANLATLSWNKNGIPLAAENDPNVIFNRLFKVDNDKEVLQRKRGFRRRGSILDLVRGQAKDLEQQVSHADKAKLDEYFTAVREVEHQLEREVDWAEKPKPKPDTAGMGDYSDSYTTSSSNFSYAKYSKLMYDLIALAYQTDSTRVITYVVRRESAGGVFPEFGVSKNFHSLTHHNNDPKNLDELAKVDTIYQQFWAGFIERMKSIKEVDGSSLLDHTMLAYSSGMGIGHSKDRLPTALFGGNALGIEHQGHLVLPEKTPLSCLWHTMVDRMDAPISGRFQDSKGVIKEIVRA